MSVGDVYHHVFSAMHTRFSVVLPGVDPMKGEALAREIEGVVGARERLMSRFDAGGPLSDLNRRAGAEPVRPPKELWDILQTCRQHWRRTHGVFDIAQTARTELYRRTAGVAAPTASELEYAGQLSGFENVLFDEISQEIRFKAPGLKLDLGGIGKGMALELAVQTLRQRGIECAFLSFGESSIAVIGGHPTGAAWPVGVADLFVVGKSWHRFELRDAALSTSGNRAMEGHIIDPRNGQAVSGLRTMSVACLSAIDAEVLSKALLLTPASERAELLKEYPGTQGVEIAYETDNTHWTGRVEWLYEFSDSQIATQP